MRVPVGISAIVSVGMAVVTVGHFLIFFLEGGVGLLIYVSSRNGGDAGFVNRI